MGRPDKLHRVPPLSYRRHFGDGRLNGFDINQWISLPHLVQNIDALNRFRELLIFGDIPNTLKTAAGQSAQTQLLIFRLETAPIIPVNEHEAIDIGYNAQHNSGGTKDTPRGEVVVLVTFQEQNGTE